MALADEIVETKGAASSAEAETEPWQLRLLRRPGSEKLPGLMVAASAVTMAITFTLFYATEQTTRDICREVHMRNCERIDRWQYIPTISFTWVPWPGYAVSLAGMLPAVVLLAVSLELECFVMRDQAERAGLLAQGARVGGYCCCCCCLKVGCALALARFMARVAAICAVIVVICQLRFNIALHGSAAFLLFASGLVLLATQQQIQRLIIEKRVELGPRGWVESARRAEQIKRWALWANVIGLVVYAALLATFRTDVEPYSAATEYLVVAALAVGVWTYGVDLSAHKQLFIDNGSGDRMHMSERRPDTPGESASPLVGPQVDTV